MDYGIGEMCEFLNVSRAAYYAWIKRMDKPDADEEKMKLVQAAYDRSRRTYGYRRITMWIYREKGQIINPKAVLRLMHRLGIQSIARRQKVYRKLTEIEQYHCYHNLLNRDFSASHPNQKWVTDVTYIPTGQGWLYLSVIKDLHDGFIVAYQTSPQNTVALVTKMLKQAYAQEMVTDGLALHSDQGHQYCSHAYYVLTQQYGIQPSMSRRGNCWDNAPMENFFSHLKSEVIHHIKLQTFNQANEVIADYIRFFNYERIQLKTRLTPFELRCQSI
jgi:putative transposase